MSNFNPSRRKFLSNSSKVALMASATPFISTLSMINEAAAQSASDYKALVCVFLFGGNDYASVSNKTVPHVPPVVVPVEICCCTLK